MSYLFLLGRVLYGGFFIIAGINHFQHLGMLAGFAGFKGVPAAKVAVMFSGLLLIVGGLSVMLGFQPTLGVICIALFLIPVTFMMHTYWSDTDQNTKINNRVNFQKNVALLGAGLMLLIVPQPWPLSVDAAMFAQQPAQARSPMIKENATAKVSPHVYIIPDDSVSLVPNVGIIVGNTATMVIDTGLGPRNALTILREVAKVSKNTDLYLVTTHFHPEHAAGSAAFPPGAKFVVSRAQQKDLDELGLSTNASFASRSPIAAELLKDVQFRRPDVLFDHEHAIDLGGLRVRLLALGSTHTRGDTIAFVEGERVLFAGDIVFNRAFLAFSQYSSGQTWLAVLDQLGSLNPATIVPSHGPMGDGSLIGQQRDVLKGLQGRARELREQGKTADEAAQTLVSEFQMKYPNWTGPNRVGAAVRSFYAEM
jgi:glyoxylase-like metal-dependent hydrolase (beta-lactamase superfamily II)/uncharacterized membrane protein YphA (DoxX/SURF4 family)